MKGTIAAILIAGFISFVISNGMVAYVLWNQIENLGKPAEEEEETEVPELVMDSTLVKEKSIPNTKEEFTRYKNLQKLVNSVFTEKMRKMNPAQIDSTRLVINAYIDSLANGATKYVDELNIQYKSANKKKQEIIILQEKIATLEEKISQLKENNAQAEINEKQQELDNSLKYLADTYASMEAAKVAQLLSSLSDEKVIIILKKMDNRKAGKVLAALSRNRSARIMQKIAEEE